jgi:hypothetical protein
MLKWIKDQFNYRAKYQALLESKNQALKNSLLILNQYENLVANLPYDHELSTRRHWEEFADRKLLNKYQAQTRDYNHLRDSHRSMTQLWEENMVKYGLNMYADWHPIETAPKDGTCFIGYFYQVESGPFYQIIGWDIYAEKAGQNPSWKNSCNESWKSFTHWMPLPKMPK